MLPMPIVSIQTACMKYIYIYIYIYIYMCVCVCVCVCVCSFNTIVAEIEKTIDAKSVYLKMSMDPTCLYQKIESMKINIFSIPILNTFNLQKKKYVSENNWLVVKVQA